MSYKQYTECVKPEDFTGAPISNAVAHGLFVGLVALVTAMLSTAAIGGHLVGAVIGVTIVTGLLSFVHWWLYGRLICLGGEACAIGMLLSVEPPSEKSIWFSKLDSDYSFNLLLPPLLPGASQGDVIAQGIAGHLIAEQAATKSIFLPFEGEHALSCDPECNGNCKDTAALHCEFEGAGMYIFYQWLKAALALFLAATVAAALCLIPVIGQIACVIAAILVGVASAAFLAGLIHGELDEASPPEIDPSLGELHQNDCHGVGADLLVVKGEWVYDSLHEGWNEIHPIRHCQRIGTWNGTTWPWDPQTECDRWCDALAKSGSPLTVHNQEKPENRWTIHPVIDGCHAADDEDRDPEPPIVR